MSAKGPEPDNVVIKNDFIKLAVTELNKMPMDTQPGAPKYKQSMIMIMLQLDKSNHLDSEKEEATIQIFEKILAANQRIEEHDRNRLSSLLNLLKSTKEKNAKLAQVSPPEKGALKGKQSQKKGINIHFELDKNREATFLIEEGRQIAHSTEQLKEGEREKVRNKRTPDNKGRVKLKSFGNYPPLPEVSKPYHGERLNRQSLQELEEYFEKGDEVEAANISLNHDGTYQVNVFSEGTKIRNQMIYNKDEMIEILCGHRFQKHLDAALAGDGRDVEFNYEGADKDALINLLSSNEEELTDMLTAMYALDIPLKGERVKIIPGCCQLSIPYKDILNILIEHPKLTEELDRAFQEALKMSPDESDESLSSESNEESDLSDSSDSEPDDDKPRPLKPSSGR